MGKPASRRPFATYVSMPGHGRQLYFTFGGNAVLFGNEKNPVHYLDDTWKFTDGQWVKVNLGIHPGPRAEAAMAYDPLRKKVVLFGGRQAGEKWVAGDTWEFDGNVWEQIENKNFPTPRSGAAMRYAPLHKRIILSGGNPDISREKDYKGPMWAWDGAAWRPMNSSIPLIFNACMAYNTRDNFILRFGGWNGKERNNETWIYQHEGWEKLSLKNSPAARNHSMMVYDPGQNTFYLFGGHDGENVFGDMWQFKDKVWTLVYEESPRRRVENGH